MSQAEIPGYEILEAMIKGIDTRIKIERDSYDSAKEAYKFYLSKDDKTCEVPLSREFLDDLNDYSGSKTSRYWLALEGKLKHKLSIPMQKYELIPFSSEVFFYDTSPDESGPNNPAVTFLPNKDKDEIVQDGLKRLRDFFEAQKVEFSRYKIPFTYEYDLSSIEDTIIELKNLLKNGPPVIHKPKTFWMHLKAAALAEFIFLEQEMPYGKGVAVKNGIAQKIKTILDILSGTIFEETNVPKYMHSYQNGKTPFQPKAKSKNISQKRYDVVFSFAGEDRKQAEKLADLLKADGFSVFYDKYEEVDLWGKNLYDHLTEVYSKLGRYCVMFLSKYYAEKQWPTLERKAAQERAFKEHKEYILPIRIDDTEIPGILDTVGYQDLRVKSIEKIYNTLKTKLSL